MNVSSFNTGFVHQSTSPVSITPIVQTQTVTTTITNFTVSCTSLTLFKNAIFCVNLNDETGKLVKRETLVLTPEEYQAWGNDDTYINNLVAQKFNMNLS
jgi:hypothetical protein